MKGFGDSIISLIIENKDDVIDILTNNKGFAGGIEGEATFVIDKYRITHADDKNRNKYGYIHAVEVKDVKITKGYDEAVKEEIEKEKAKSNE